MHIIYTQSPEIRAAEEKLTERVSRCMCVCVISIHAATITHTHAKNTRTHMAIIYPSLRGPSYKIHRDVYAPSRYSLFMCTLKYVPCIPRRNAMHPDSFYIAKLMCVLYACDDAAGARTRDAHALSHRG